MAILASQVISRASRTLNDIGYVRWSEAEMIDAINDAEQAVLEARPDLFEHVATHAMVAGPRQTVPADCYLLLDVLYNVNSAGTPTSNVTLVSRSDLDRCKSDWMMDDPSTQVEHWMQADEERSVFYVYPRQPDAAAQLGNVMLRYAKYPTAISGSGDSLTVRDEMMNPIYYFTVMRMLEKDEKFAGSPQAARFMNLFAATMEVRTQGEERANAARRDRES